MNKTRKSIEDGGALGITPRMKPTYPVSTHHAVVPTMATAMDLVEALQQFARFALANTPDLTVKERQYLKDMTRQDAHARGYGFTALQRLVEIAPRTAQPHQLEEAIRGQVLRQMPAAILCPVDTYINETRAQAQADVAQGRFLVERTTARRDAAIDGLGLHLSSIRVALDALHVWPVRRVS